MQKEMIVVSTSGAKTLNKQKNKEPGGLRGGGEWLLEKLNVRLIWAN